MIRARHVLPIVVVALAACGGDSGSSTTEAPATDPASTEAPATDPPATDSPATDPPATDPASTDPPTTDPPATDPPGDEVSLTDNFEFGDGFFAMGVAEGWSVRGIAPELGRTYEDGENLPYDEWRDADQHDIAALTDGTVEMTIFREGRYALAPSVFAWDSAILDALSIQPNIQVTTEWGGGRGNSTRGTIGGELFARLDTTEVGGQYVAALALTDTEPGPEVDARIDLMLASVVIDAGVIPLLNHSIDLRTEATEADTGSTPFRIGILAEPDWLGEPDGGTTFVDPDGDGFSDTLLRLTEGQDFETLIEEDLAANPEWFDVEPVAEDVEYDGVPGRIYWEGDPDTATAAILFTNDGVVHATSFLYAPDTEGLLQAMIDEVEIRFSSVRPT